MLYDRKSSYVSVEKSNTTSELSPSLDFSYRIDMSSSKVSAFFGSIAGVASWALMNVSISQWGMLLIEDTITRNSLMVVTIMFILFILFSSFLRLVCLVQMNQSSYQMFWHYADFHTRSDVFFIGDGLVGSGLNHWQFLLSKNLCCFAVLSTQWRKTDVVNEKSKKC